MKTLFLTLTCFVISGFVFSNSENTNYALSENYLLTTNLLSAPPPPCAETMTLAFSSATGSSITVNWATPPLAAWYSFRYKASSSPTWIMTGTLTGSATSRIFSSLAANTSYDIEGRVFCADGTSGPWSTTLVASTNPLSGCELPPATVSATVSGASATVSWSAVSGAGWYEVRYKVGSGAWVNGGTVSSSSTSKVLNGLLPCETYTYEVRTFCPSGAPSAYSGTTFSAASMTLSASNVNGNVVMTSWVDVPGAMWYEFRYKMASSSTWINGGTQAAPATSKSFSGLNPSTAYNFASKVYCSNSAAPVWSPTVTITTGALTNCGMPPAIAYGTITGLSAEVTWSSVTNAAWYEFRYKPTGSPSWISGGTAGPSATSKMYQALAANTSYNFEARTFCSNGVASPWGATTFTTSALASCEEAPHTFSSVSFDPNSIELSWLPVSGAGWYGIQYKESSSSTWLSAGTVGPIVGVSGNIIFLVSALLPSTSYDFQIRTFCPNGVASAYGTPGSQTTISSAPTIVVNDKTDLNPTKVLAVTNHVTTVYPNPSSQKVNINIFMTESDNTSIKLMDMSGRLVREISLSTVEGTNTFTVDIQDLSIGMYTLFVYQNGQLLHTDKVKKN